MSQLIRVATYNIHKCRGLDRRMRPERIAEVLREVDADVIALQEVTGLDAAAPERNQVRSIAEALGLNFCVGANRRVRGEAYGNALLSRLPIIEHRNHNLTWWRYEPRGCLEAEINFGDARQPHPMRVYNVHFGTGLFERPFQADSLMRYVDHGRPEPRIVLGDFNEWARGRATRLMSARFKTAEPKQSSGRARTYPGVLPIVNLDHIYYDSAFELVEIKLHRSRLALIASDHLPLVADFRVEFRPTG